MRSEGWRRGRTKRGGEGECKSSQLAYQLKVTCISRAPSWIQSHE